jgi:hypothetical protein
VVVEQALGDVQDSIARHGQAFEHEFEAARRRLVGPRLLRRDHLVERRRQAAR